MVPTLDLFRHQHVLSHSTNEGRKDMGWYYFSRRLNTGKPMVIDKLSKFSTWKERFFFVSSIDSQYPLHLNNNWRMVNAKALNKPLVLSDSELNALRSLKNKAPMSALEMRNESVLREFHLLVDLFLENVNLDDLLKIGLQPQRPLKLFLQWAVLSQLLFWPQPSVRRNKGCAEGQGPSTDVRGDNVGDRDPSGVLSVADDVFAEVDAVVEGVAESEAVVHPEY
ncbi:hypothetical protein NE237_005411 [Protea cynaroides]|uniref:Uncharacterized protein n=1 Tax=Protea cynaroides TaxID=273540 RepID=A0A9Q0QUJ3_9MAGN|nr:hypothetical protein NE237_005411 [Protea cynaroides]